MNHSLGGRGGMQRKTVTRLNNALIKALQWHDFWISNLDIVLRLTCLLKNWFERLGWVVELGCPSISLQYLWPSEITLDT